MKKQLHWVFFLCCMCFGRFSSNLCVLMCHLIYVFVFDLFVIHRNLFIYFIATCVYNRWLLDGTSKLLQCSAKLLSYLKIIQFNSSWLVCNSQLLLCINSILWDEVPLFLIPTKISKVSTWLTWDMLQHKHMSQATSSIHYHHNFSNVKT